MNGVPYGSRTRVTALRRRCPRPLDEGDLESNCYIVLDDFPFLVVPHQVRGDETRGLKLVSKREYATSPKNSIRLK